MKYCEKCKMSFPTDQVFCSECGNKLDAPEINSDEASSNNILNVNFTWPKSFAWSLSGSILIIIDRKEPPIELKNGKSATVSLPIGLHHFTFCAKGFKKGVEFEYTLLNNAVSFVCKPSSEAIAWGILTSKPSVTVTQEAFFY